MKTLIHIHTDYSDDARTSHDDLIAIVHAQNIDCVAVTDHDTIRGARELAARADFRVIVGQEVTTREGHLIGLFISHEIPRWLSAVETARRIHAQGGLVLAPHPFSSFCGFSLRETAATLVGHLDAVEVANAQSPWLRDDRKAAEFAARYGLPGYVGSDSHLPCSVAPCYQVMDDFDGPAEFLSSLWRATLCPGRHPLRYFLEYGWRSQMRMLLGRLPSGFGVNASPANAVASAASSGLVVSAPRR